MPSGNMWMRTRSKILEVLGGIYVHLLAKAEKWAGFFWSCKIHREAVSELGADAPLHCSVKGPIKLTGIDQIRLGYNVHIGSQSVIRAEGGLQIDDNTHISHSVTIYTVNHEYEGDTLPYDNNLRSRPVRIGRNVWVGTKVIILPGSTIEEGAIIGAGSVVHGNISALSIIGSSPSVPIGSRDFDHYYALEHGKNFGGHDGKPLG